MSMPSSNEKTAGENFLADLRKQTAESHNALEENKVSKALLSEAVTVADYRAYLVKMYGLIKGIEQDVYPMLTKIFDDLPGRRKAHLIEEDLEKIGMAKKEISRIPVKKFTPADEAAAAGMMYVLEGSSLGGRILYKHVNKHLQFSETTGASFFNGYAESTGPMWKDFVRDFTGYAVDQKKEQAVINAAMLTFENVGEWLSKEDE